MLRNSYLETMHKLLLILTFAVVAFACKDDEGDGGATSAVFRYDTVNCETTVNQLLLEGSANLSYKATITEGQEWLSFSPQQTGVTVHEGAITPIVFVYSQKNTTPQVRKAVVAVEFSNGARHEATLTQLEYTSSANYDKQWAEQPRYEEGASFLYKTYYTTLANTRYVRNYSICYDVDKKVARWVAYPLHTSYTLPNVGRTDAWAYDPNTQQPVIPDSDQQYIIETYGTGYARGHQCPSADRYSTIATNEMTFYATNMMPQNSRFNSGVWGTLESKVRENMVKDTLYVVTGTFFGNSETTTDRKGNVIGVPSNCWKVLLRTRKGNSGKRIQDCTADELMGIGFWFANSSSSSGSPANYSMSIAEVEERTGFTFFRNLPAEAAAAVKQQNDPSEWKMY